MFLALFWLSSLAVLAVFAGQAEAALRNRYSFNEGAAADASNRMIIDSVGGQDGTVLGAGSSATVGQLVLPGGSSQTQAYVDLPNGLVSSLTDATFEGWYTITTAQAWGRMFDFGSTVGPGGTGTAGMELTGPGGGGEGQDYIFYAPMRGTNIDEQRAGMRNFDPTFRGAAAGTVQAGEDPIIDPEFNQTLGEQYHVVVVFDADGGNDPGEATVALYINGALPPGDGGNPEETPLQLANLNDVNNWLGRSNWTGDANFGGSYNEFRIYDHAMTADEVGKSAFFGPDEAITGDVLKVEVNASTGQVTLVNNLSRPVNIDYYEITSAGGALSTSGWNSLDDQEGADPPGQGWDESGGASANQLIELFLGGGAAGTPFPANGSLTIGNAFNPAVFGAGNPGDLEFRFGISEGTGLFLPGSVSYVGAAPAVAGDYNQNGTVDAADYVVWRNSTGNPTLPNRGTGITGPVGTNDYNFWRARLGATSGAGAGIVATGIPEPTTLCSLVCCLFGFGALTTVTRRR
jgi:hypothetical protein